MPLGFAIGSPTRRTSQLLAEGLASPREPPPELAAPPTKSSAEPAAALPPARRASAKGGRRGSLKGSLYERHARRGQHSAGAFQSISRRFINDLNNLVQALTQAEAHFIRCVKPSATSTPAQFDGSLVLAQLRSAGVFDAVALMQAAYPTRIRYDDIHGKFASLLPAKKPPAPLVLPPRQEYPGVSL